MSTDHSGPAPDADGMAEEHPVGWLGDPKAFGPSYSFMRGDHAEIAEFVPDMLHKMGRRHIVADEADLHGHNPLSGLWEIIPDWMLSQIVQAYAGCPVIKIVNGKETEKPLRVNAGTVSGTIKLVLHNAAEPDFFASAAPGIAFADGFSRISADGIERVPHSPKHRARHAYSFALPSAGDTPDRFLRFLEDIFRGDLDRADKIAALQELYGAALAGVATTYERAVVLLGEGDNGKTRCTQILAAGLPTGSVTGLAPHLWADQYQLPRLIAARLNIVADLTEDELVPAVKAIISGELVCARDVRRRSTCFRPRSAHLFGANKLPPTTDKSPGFFRRWNILRLHRSFTGDPGRDPQIVQRIVPAEIPQLVRWGLEGAVRLMRQRGYTLPVSHELEIARWRGREEPVRVFIESQTWPAAAGEPGTSSTNLYVAFAAWLGGLHEKVITHNHFAREMTGLGLVPYARGDGHYYRVVLRRVGP